MATMKRFFAASAAFGVSSLLVVACSGTGDSGAGLGGPAPGGGVGGDNGGGAGDTNAGGSDPGNPGDGLDGGGGGGALIDVSTSTDAMVNAETSCANLIADGEQQPVDIFIMLDKSGSMKDPKGAVLTKWKAVVAGLTQFVNDAATAGMGVGLQYFPLAPGGGGATCPLLCDSPANSTACGACGGTCLPFINVCSPKNVGDTSCDVADYAKAAIPIATLPGNAQAITESLQATSPSGGTPTYAALGGAVQYASEWRTQHPDHKTVVLLATDGDPDDSCSPRDMNSIAKVAADAHKNGIDTYVIGMEGATMNWLNAWASAGGTVKAYDASDPSKFSEQMNEIRGTAMSCSYGVPTADGGKIDYANVKVTAKVGGGEQLVPAVAKADACGTSDGWYYDDPASPKTVTLCPKTCDALQSSGNAGIELNLGCVIPGPL